MQHFLKAGEEKLRRHALSLEVSSSHYACDKEGNCHLSTGHPLEATKLKRVLQICWKVSLLYVSLSFLICVVCFMEQDQVAL